MTTSFASMQKPPSLRLQTCFILILISFRPFADAVKVARRIWVSSVGIFGGSLLMTRIRRIRLVPIPPIFIPGRRHGQRLHGDVNEAGVGASLDRRFIQIQRTMGRPRFASKMALEPLGGLHLSRFIFLFQVQWLLGQSILAIDRYVFGKAYKLEFVHLRIRPGCHDLRFE